MIGAAELSSCDLRGESLEDILRTGPIASTRLLDIALQIAAALAPLHAEGRIYGHLDAATIFLDHDARVVLPDLHPGIPGSPQHEQHTLGLILQAASAGQAPMDPFCWVIDRLLAPNPEDRYSATRDLYLALRDIRDRAPATPASQPVKWLRARPIVTRRPFLAVPLTLLSCGLFIYFLASHAPGQLHLQPGVQSFPVWSADGRRILFVKSVGGIGQVFVQTSGSPTPHQLSHSSEPSTNPRWSSDGSAVIFESAGKLWTVSP